MCVCCFGFTNLPGSKYRAALCSELYWQHTELYNFRLQELIKRELPRLELNQTHGDHCSCATTIIQHEYDDRHLRRTDLSCTWALYCSRCSRTQPACVPSLRSPPCQPRSGPCPRGQPRHALAHPEARGWELPLDLACAAQRNNLLTIVEQKYNFQFHRTSSFRIQ